MTFKPLCKRCLSRDHWVQVSPTDDRLRCSQCKNRRLRDARALTKRRTARADAEADYLNSVSTFEARVREAIIAGVLQGILTEGGRQ